MAHQMTTIYQQETKQVMAIKPKKHLFWNRRGRVIVVKDETRIKELIQQGFIRCEIGIKEGDYNPVFDKGNLISNDFPIKTIKKISKNTDDITFINV